MSTVLQAAPERLVFESMGTTASVVAGAGCALDEATRAGVLGVFDELDDRFSLYKPDSEATAVADRRLPVDEASASYRATLELARTWEHATAGAFTPTAPDGHLDLSGVVKAMAIDGAGRVLHRAGLDHWAVGAGGDVLTSGREGVRGGAGGDDDGGDVRKPWVVGLVDPSDRQRLAPQVTCREGLAAVATSGSAERGEHIWRSDDTFAQVSVAGPDILTADVLATAIVAGGPETFELARRQWPVEVLAWTREGRPMATNAFLTWPSTSRFAHAG